MGDVNYHPDATNAAPYVGGVGGEYGNWGVGSMMLLINNPNNTISTVTATVPAPNRGFGGDSYSSRVMGSESSLSSGKSLSDQDLGVQEIANSSSRGGARMATEPESSCTNPSNNNNNNNTQPEVPVDALKTRIAAHPRYPQLLAAYMSCQKIGAPPEVVALLDDFTHHHRRHPAVIDIGMDPELDHFMEAFCQLLEEFHNELSKPYGEAIEFLNRMETQLNSLNLGGTNFCVNSGSWEERDMEGGGFSSEEDLSREEGCEGQGGDSNAAQDKELKEQLLKKYIGYFGSLKQEFLKKKKKGKLPKEARQKLLDWWDAHYSWPYPSEGDKVSLAECTGLDQKQINNWFINQRKRHWKPSEDMQFFW